MNKLIDELLKLQNNVIDLLKENKELQDNVLNLQEENENLKKQNKKISHQHIHTLEKLIETQTKIENTIEYIKENEYIDLNGYDLLKILGGEEWIKKV